MPFFSYKALKNNNTRVEGRIEAENIREARAHIRQQDLLPLEVIDETNFAVKKATKKAPKKRISSLSLKDKIDFTTTLQTLTSTGISIIETLLFLEANAESDKIKNIAAELRKQIIAGSTLAETIEKYQKVFGRIYVGLVKAGEDSGELDKTLERMLHLLKKQDAIKGKVIGALIYPCFVIVVAIVVVILMLVIVFPAFKDMFDSMGGTLPITTQLCMNAGLAIKKFWYIAILFFASIIFLIYKIFTTPATKKEVDKIALKIPLLNNLLEFSNFSNFIAVLQVAYDAGIPIIDCLYLANITLDNWVLKDAVSQAASKVQQGTHLSIALKSTGKIPNMVLFMISTGEQSGRLGELLIHCTEYIDKKLDSIIDKFTKLTEPVMLVVIGGIVLFLMLSLYQPLFGMYSNMGG